VGTIVAVCTSPEKHTPKQNVGRAELIKGWGLAEDAHAGSERQVSLLSLEGIERMKEMLPELQPGDFAENLTVSNLDWESLGIGSRIAVGEAILLEVTQIGKRCHRKCDIYRKTGSCIMPREGIFARILEGGTVRAGDPIRILRENSGPLAANHTPSFPKG
jgi:MOSC domain-containing protein YiiM